MQQKELPFRLHSGAVGEIFAQMSFRQQVGEERRQAGGKRPRICIQLSRRAVKRQAQYRPLGILDMLIVKGEDVSVAGQPRDHADAPAMQVHGQG